MAQKKRALSWLRLTRRFQVACMQADVSTSASAAVVMVGHCNNRRGYTPRSG